MRLQFAVSLLIGCLVGSAAAVAQASTFSLIPFDESVTQIASPSSTLPAFSYNNGIAAVVTSTPVLCSNTSAPTTSGSGFAPTYFSDYAVNSSGASPQPFVFGASSSSSSVSPTVSDLGTLAYNFNSSTGSTTLQVDSPSPLSTLVCYVLNANGVHKLTRGLFVSGFEGPANEGLIGNTTVSLKVFHVPASANDYYGYTIDVTIPALPSNADCTTLDCKFSLVEGYDTSIFDPANGLWCLAPAGAQSCPTPVPPGGSLPSLGDININYSTYVSTVSLQAPVSPASAISYHFVVIRYLRSSLSALPNTSQPLAVAALFSPLDLEENKLDDNVSIGTNQLSN